MNRTATTDATETPRRGVSLFLAAPSARGQDSASVQSLVPTVAAQAGCSADQVNTVWRTVEAIAWLAVAVAVFGLLAVTAYQAFLNSQIP